MPVEISWYDAKKTLLYIKVSANWTWDDFDYTDKRIHELGNAINHKFDVIADLTEGQSIPAGDIISTIAQGININPPNYRWSVWVKTPPRLKAAIEVVKSSTIGYPKRMFADTVEEAFAIIEKHRQDEND